MLSAPFIAETASEIVFAEDKSTDKTEGVAVLFNGPPTVNPDLKNTELSVKTSFIPVEYIPLVAAANPASYKITLLFISVPP